MHGKMNVKLSYNLRSTIQEDIIYHKSQNLFFIYFFFFAMQSVTFSL
jgi:hypothetical protein